MFGLIRRMFGLTDWRALYEAQKAEIDFVTQMGIITATAAQEVLSRGQQSEARIKELEAELESAAEKQVTVGTSVVSARLSDDGQWLCFDLSDGRKQAMPLSRIELRNDTNLAGCFADLEDASHDLEEALDFDHQAHYRINHLSSIAATAMRGMSNVIKEAVDALGVDSSVIQTPGALGDLISKRCAGCKSTTRPVKMAASKKVGSK